MKIGLVVLALIALAWVYFASRNSHVAVDRTSGDVQVLTPSAVRVQQISAVVDQLTANAQEQSWAAFTFNPPSQSVTGDSAVNLQYSFEGGRVGLDWVLLAPRNVADKEKVSAFIKQQNHQLLEREVNGVRYLRVEGGDLANLGISMLNQLYGTDRDTEMDLFTGKFEFRP
jgi:hypothetical protein